MNNKITDVTRQGIADEMQIARLWYHGREDELNFLCEFFDLKSLPSRDHRYNNAYDDIYQHTVNNNDYDFDWIYTDSRINLLRCDDKTYLKFLSETLHPIVRTDQADASKILEIYNKYLYVDGFEIVQIGEISGKPTYTGREKIIGQAKLEENCAKIKRYLNTEYVNSKIKIMEEALHKDTDLAIGTTKELLETTCKSILNQKKVYIFPDWSLPKLLKETTSNLDFTPKEAADPEKAEKGIKQILNGITSIVQGVSELRNSYGTGHGKDSNFKGLETKYAKFLTGVVTEIVILYLATNGETAELVEVPLSK